jgi:hypothetical protein
MGAEKTLPAPSVQVPKFIAWLLFNQGVKQRDIARRVRKCRRTVQIWIKDIENVMVDHPHWARAAMAGDGFLSMAMSVYKNYLQGKGEKTGGDLEVATKIFEIFGIIPRAGKKLSMTEAAFIDEGRITQSAINTDIPVEAPSDEDFGREAPEQLRRIIGVMRRLKIQ